MCQGVVLEFLEESPQRWFSVRQIADGTDLSLNIVSLNCKMLRKHNFVFYRIENRYVGSFMKDIIVYKFKRLR